MAQRITAEEAAALIQDNMTLGVGGFGAYAAPDELLSALAERYERLGSPRALTAVCGIPAATGPTAADWPGSGLLACWIP